MLQGAMNLHKREEIMIPIEIEMRATNTTITSDSTRYKTASDSTRYNSMLYVPSNHKNVASKVSTLYPRQGN